MELKKVQRKLLQTIVRQRRRQSERNKGAASRGSKHASQCREEKGVNDKGRDVRWGKRREWKGKRSTSLKEELCNRRPACLCETSSSGWIKNANGDELCHVTMWRRSYQRCAIVRAPRRKLKCSPQAVMFLYRYERRGLNANDASIGRLDTVNWATARAVRAAHCGPALTRLRTSTAGCEDISEVKLELLYWLQGLCNKMEKFHESDSRLHQTASIRLAQKGEKANVCVQ